jgi:WG containing repeat
MKKAGYKMYPIKENNLWGFANEKGETVIQPRFDSVRFFRNGLAVAQYHGKYGYIKLNGKWQIKPKYTSAIDFFQSNNLIVAHVAKRNGIYRINQFGLRRFIRKTIYVIYINAGGCKITYPIQPNLNFIQTLQGFDYVYQYDICKDGVTIQVMHDTLTLNLDTVMTYGVETILARKGEKYGFLSVTKWRRAKVDITKYPDHRSWARAHAVQWISGDFIYDQVVFQIPEYSGEVSYSTALTRGVYRILNSEGKPIINSDYLNVKYIEHGMAFVEFEPSRFGYVDLNARAEYFDRKVK